MSGKQIYMPEDHMDELYNSANFLVRYVHNNRLDNIIRHLPLGRGLKILDAGCGEGHLLEKLYKYQADNDYYGVDLTEIALVKARQRCPQAKFILSDLAKIDLPSAGFDIIICTETLEHISNYRGVLKEFERLLKPNGCLIITFPNEFWWTVSRFFLGRRPIKVVDHVNFFTPKKIRRLLPWPPVIIFGLPWRWPFFLSLGCLAKFKKTN